MKQEEVTLPSLEMVDYPYTLIYTHNRSSSIKISEEGNVFFMIPQRYKTDAKLLRQLFEKAEKMRERYQKRPKLEKWNDEGILLFGEWVQWEEFLWTGKSQPSQAVLEKKLKAILYEYAKERLDIFSTRLGKNYQSLTVRKAKSRRGSCSFDQKIMINLFLIFLPRDCIQYVIAHEAAHLVEKNHSSAFWELVKELFPKYYTVRKRLKQLIIM